MSTTTYATLMCQIKQYVDLGAELPLSKIENHRKICKENKFLGALGGVGDKLE